MALATRCPACSTVFRISTAQAAAKGGMVRCGMCRNVFNSLDALVRVEDLDVVEEVIVGADGTPLAKPRKPSFEPSASTDDAQTVFIARDDEDTEAAVARDFEHTIVSAWWLPDARDEHVSRSGPILSKEHTGGGPADTGGGRATGRRSEPAPEPSMADGTNPVFMRPEPEPERAPRALRWTLAVLSVLAAVVLVVQFTYMWRDELAVRWPPARPWLVDACRVLQCNVGYPIHADSITIESASVQTTGANSNVYVVIALLRNRDVVDVRYPHLELVLTDLQDQPILRRDLRPEDFVGGNRPPSAGFPAQSELPVRISFELNNLRFAGYRLNQFYP